MIEHKLNQFRILQSRLIKKCSTLDKNKKYSYFCNNYLVKMEDVLNKLNHCNVNNNKLDIILKSRKIFVEDALNSNDIYVILNQICDLPLSIEDIISKL